MSLSLFSLLTPLSLPHPPPLPTHLGPLILSSLGSIKEVYNHLRLIICAISVLLDSYSFLPPLLLREPQFSLKHLIIQLKSYLSQLPLSQPISGHITILANEAPWRSQLRISEKFAFLTWALNLPPCIFLHPAWNAKVICLTKCYGQNGLETVLSKFIYTSNVS